MNGPEDMFKLGDTSPNLADGDEGEPYFGNTYYDDYDEGEIGKEDSGYWRPLRL